MSKMKFELNRKGVADLMKSKGMQEILKDHATNIKNRAGHGFEQDVYVGQNRANAMVWADTPHAQADNYEHNTLLKSVR